MPTPQITLRVSKDKHARWKLAAAAVDSSVSEEIRARMDDWSDVILDCDPPRPAPTPSA